VAQKKKQTVKKIGAVKLKEIDKYQRIAQIQRSGYTDPTRPCCVSMQAAHVRMVTGAKKGNEDMYDGDGQLKDPGKWDYRAALQAAAAKVRGNEQRPVFHLDQEIHEFINNSFVNVALAVPKKQSDEDNIPVKKTKAKLATNDN